jgi:hypothetical protein
MKRIALLILLCLSASCSTFSSSSVQPTSTVFAIPATTVTTTSSTRPSNPTLTVEVPTPSPLPTLSPAEAEAMVLDLLQDNGGCFFPCWWGLVPGETGEQKSKPFLEKFATIAVANIFNEYGSYARWLVPNNNLLLDLSVSVAYDQQSPAYIRRIQVTTQVTRKLDEGGSEIVWENLLNRQFLQAYMLPQILSTYGQPNKVLVFANEGWRYFELILDYSHQGFAIWYSMPLESSGEKFLGCTSKSFTKSYFWAPELAYTWAEGVAGTGDKSEIDALNRDFRPIEEVTSITSEEFYDTVMNPDYISCLETPKELWPGP